MTYCMCVYIDENARSCVPSAPGYTTQTLNFWNIFFSFSDFYGEMRAMQEHKVKSNPYREVHD